MHPTPLALNEYIDGESSPSDRSRIERHLEMCDDCRAHVSAFEEIKGAARALGPIAPPARVWQQLDATRQMAERQPWRGTIDWARAGSFGPLATAAALLVATLVGVRFGPLTPRSAAPAPAATLAIESAGGGDAPLANVDLQQADGQYEEAIGDLQKAATDGQDALDTGTAETLRTTLAAVDAAIHESRAALAAEPDNEAAQDSLLNGLKAKLAVLQDTVDFIDTARTANPVKGMAKG